MDIFNKKAKESEQTTGKLDDLFRALSPSALVAVAGITALVGAVKSLSKASLDNYAHFEKLQMGLTTFFQDADKGKSKFEELRKLSNETTFGVDELTDSFTQLANVGVNVDSIKGKLTMLGDLAQGDKAKFAELTSIYAKINSVGKAGSMQLQQIASRGIPIYDILKKIGVQGIATADDITKAFEQMTAEGGQFHNAMENINETIEGKQGFISDYLKEMSVNFAEVTGLADAYKDTLDILKEAIGAVSDKLLEWSKDPVMKAVISGVFAGAIASIVTALLTSLIPTLGKVIAKLTTIKILEGPKGWATLAVAGIAVAVGAYASYSRSLNKAEEDNKKLLDAVEKTKKAMGNDYNLLNVGVNTGNTAIKSRDSTKNTLEAYKKNLAGFEEELEKAHKAVSDIEEKMMEDGGGGLTGYENQLKRAQAEVDKWRESIAHTNKSIEEHTRLLNYWEGEVQKLDISTLTAEFEKIHEGTISKESQEMSALQSQMDTVLAYQKKIQELNGKKDANGNIIDYNKSKQAIDETIRYLENKLNGVNAWEDVFKNVTGIAVPKSGSNGKTRGELAGEAYVARTDKLFEAQVKAKSLLGDKNAEKNVAKEFVQNIEKQIESLISNIDIDQPFAETDATIKALNAELQKYKGIVQETGEAQIESITSLSELSAKLMDYAVENKNVGAMAGSMAISAAQGTNAGDIANGAMQGFAIGGPIGALIGALISLAMKAETVTDALNDLDLIITPLIRIINAILKPITSLMRIILTVLNPILEALADVVEGVFDFFFGWLNEYADNTREANEEKEKEIERQRALTDAYSYMLTTLRDVQEEYEKRKRAINAEGYNESVTGVHDMILTPQGRFSTDPDDYIIATKNPSGLNNGGKGNVIINNYSNAQVEASQDDDGNTIILISQKIAMDYANGSNGWDNAVISRQARTAGRNLVV